MSQSSDGVGRRTFLTTGAGVAGIAAAGSPAAAQDSPFGDWFAKTSNYEGVVDETGKSTVTVEVGAKGNNGNFAFGPAAIRVDPGTEVVWKWTGKGGSHNVVASDGSFECDLASEAGHTFSHTFEEKGVTKYYCSPHKPMGMRGAIVVGSDAAADAKSASSGGSGSNTGDLFTLGFGGVLVAVLLGLPLATVRRRANGR